MSSFVLLAEADLVGLDLPRLDRILSTGTAVSLRVFRRQTLCQMHRLLVSLCPRSSHLVGALMIVYLDLLDRQSSALITVQSAGGRHMDLKFSWRQKRQKMSPKSALHFCTLKFCCEYGFHTYLFLSPNYTDLSKILKSSLHHLTF